MRKLTNSGWPWLIGWLLCSAVSSWAAEEPGVPEQLAAEALRAGQTRDRHALDALAKSLRHPSPMVRQAAAWAFGELHAEASEFVSSLSATLMDPDARVRWGAAVALGRMGRAASASEDALWMVARDRHVEVRCAALIALRTVSTATHRAALPTLCESLQCPVADVQAEAIATLTQIHSRWPDDAKGAIVQSLASVLQGPNDDVRLAAAVLLGDIGLAAAPAVPEVAKLVNDRNDYVRSAVQQTLERFVDELDQRWNQLSSAQQAALRRACAAVVESLADASSSSMIPLAKRFRQLIDGIQRTSADDVLTTALPRDHDVLAKAATIPASTGDGFGSEKTWQWIVASLMSCVLLWGIWQSWSVRRRQDQLPSTCDGPKGEALVESSTAAAAVGSMSLMLEAVSASDPEVRRRALMSLRGFGTEALPTFVQALQDADPGVRHTAVVTLGHIGLGAIDAVPQLVLSLTDPDVRVRAAAAFALSVFGPHAREAVPALRQALSDDYPDVRARAAFALGQIGPSARRAALELARLVSDSDVSVRRNAVSALGGIGADSASALPVLRAATEDPDAHVRRCAVTALGMIDAKQAATELKRALLDADPDVRACARCALAMAPETSAVTATVSSDGTIPPTSNDARKPDHGAEVSTEIPASTLMAVTAEDHHVAVSNDMSGWATADSDIESPLPQPTEQRSSAPSLQIYQPEPDVVLAETPSETAAPQIADLLVQLEDADSETRWRAMLKLVEFGQEAVPEVIASLNHRNPEVRRLLVVTLGRIGEAARPAVPSLLVALHDVNADVRGAAADCLGHVGVVSSSMIQALMQSLHDPNAEVRRYAATTLGRFGRQAREAATALQVASISDIAAKVRVAAQAALKRIFESQVQVA